MSTGTKLSWTEAAAIAQRLTTELLQVAARVKTAGSVRRRKEEVGDIEIVVEPRTVEIGLFAEPKPDVEIIRETASGWGILLKAGEKSIQAQLLDGTKVDLFLVTPPAQWGSILAIRTGPAELSKHAVTCMLERGYRHREGRVIDRRGELVPTPTEEEFFRLAGLPCLPPQRRHTPAAFKALV